MNAGGAASITCSSTTELSVGAFTLEDSEPMLFAFYTAPINSPTILGVEADEFRLQFTDAMDADAMANFNGAMTGTFNLAMETDPNTCSRCLLIRADGGLAEWSQQSGTINVMANPITGTLNATLTNVVLAPSAGIALQNSNCYSVTTLTATAP